MPTPIILIHGGAGTINRKDMSAEKEQHYLAELSRIADAGKTILANKGSAVDAVTTAVLELENSPLFNAGYGAVFTAAETHELDAAIMDGRNRSAGAVCSVKHLKNPILAARAVMEHSPHVLFSGAGAETFAAQHHLETVSNNYFSLETRRAQLHKAQNHISLDHDTPINPDSKHGTVGAVALDSAGNLAAATSTGGMTNKAVGRVGDSPIIGAGCYADNRSIAASSTGTGEDFIRLCAAHEIAARIRHAGEDLATAAAAVIDDELTAIGGSGGMIIIDHNGNIALPFNCEGMYRAIAIVGQPTTSAIYREYP